MSQPLALHVRFGHRRSRKGATLRLLSGGLILRALLPIGDGCNYSGRRLGPALAFSLRLRGRGLRLRPGPRSGLLLSALLGGLAAFFGSADDVPARDEALLNNVAIAHPRVVELRRGAWQRFRVLKLYVRAPAKLVVRVEAYGRGATKGHKKEPQLLVGPARREAPHQNAGLFWLLHCLAARARLWRHGLSP